MGKHMNGLAANLIGCLTGAATTALATLTVIRLSGGRGP